MPKDELEIVNKGNLLSNKAYLNIFRFFDAKSDLLNAKLACKKFNRIITDAGSQKTDYAEQPVQQIIHKQFQTIALSHDGNIIAATQCWRDGIYLFNAHTGQEIIALSCNSQKRNYDCLAFTKDNKQLLMRCTYGPLYILNLQTYEVKCLKNIAPCNMSGVKLFPLANNKFILTYPTFGNGHHLGIYNHDSQLIRKIEIDSNIKSPFISKDEKFLIFCSKSNCYLYDLSTASMGQTIIPFSFPHPLDETKRQEFPIHLVKLTPDNKYIVCVSQASNSYIKCSRERLMVWDIENKKLCASFDTGITNDFDISNDGRYIARAANDGVEILDWQDDVNPSINYIAFKTWAHDILFAPNDNKIIVRNSNSFTLAEFPSMQLELDEEQKFGMRLK